MDKANVNGGVLKGSYINEAMGEKTCYVIRVIDEFYPQNSDGRGRGGAGRRTQSEYRYNPVKKTWEVQP